ncbi:37434_t:CDS:2 [Gigaspora margarita]|uniref:37434_t:CDS:1 n=1 Tax=Gigaspora margarita TaxID=4874 RepID=A0ABN7UWJ9_GIGMA|nr:37434_t:CDS:2 [Gigaspora margarita]
MSKENIDVTVSIMNKENLSIWDEKVEQELKALKDITNKILASQEKYIKFQDVSENNDSFIPIVSASVEETTCEEVQKGPSNIEFKNAGNTWAINNDEGNIP